MWERPHVGVGVAGGEALAFPRVAEHLAQAVVAVRIERNLPFLIGQEAVPTIEDRGR